MEQRKIQLQKLLTDKLDGAKAALIDALKESNSECELTLLAKLESDPNLDWVASGRDVLGQEYLDLINSIERYDAALCQLELGLYGLCSDCEEPIEQARLRKDVSEQRCARCAKEVHQKTA